MATSKLLFQYPSDDVTPVPTCDVTPDPDYPLDNLVDGDPANPCKFVTRYGTLLFDFGIAQTIAVIAILNHNLSGFASSGHLVTVQANATNVWTSPSFSWNMVLPTAPAEDGRFANPWLDVEAANNGPASYRYWRIVMGAQGTDEQDEFITIGAIKFCAGALSNRQLIHNISDGAIYTDDHPVVTQRTAMNVKTVYDLGDRIRSIQAKHLTSDTGYAQVLALHRACRGAARAFLMVPDPTTNDAYLVRWAGPFAATAVHSWLFESSALAFEEEPNGLPL